MVESPPASALVMVQPQVIFAALEILLDGPAPSTQSQRPALGGRLLEASHIDVIGISMALRPIGRQPARRPRSALFLQIAVEINFFPGQSRGPLLAIGCLPCGGMPLCRFEAFDPVAQLLTLGRGFGDAPILWTFTEFGAVGPPQPVFLRVKEIFQPQSANPTSQLAGVAINRVPQNRSHRQPIGQRLFNQVAGDLRLGLEFYSPRDTDRKSTRLNSSHLV